MRQENSVVTWEIKFIIFQNETISTWEQGGGEGGD